jgi:uncharacterized protein HemY
MFRAGYAGQLGRVVGVKEGRAIFIGIGTIVVIVIIVLVVLALRR